MFVLVTATRIHEMALKRQLGLCFRPKRSVLRPKRYKCDWQIIPVSPPVQNTKPQVHPSLPTSAKHETTSPSQSPHQCKTQKEGPPKRALLQLNHASISIPTSTIQITSRSIGRSSKLLAQSARRSKVSPPQCGHADNVLATSCEGSES